MNNKITALLALTALLTACALAPQSTGPRPATSTRGGKPPKYEPAPPPSDYGEWHIDSGTCSIFSRATDFTLRTDGRPYKGTITVRAQFRAPLAMPPRGEVSEILAPVPIEGTRGGYNVILAYDAMNAAHMMKADTYLIMQYQPITGSQVMESSFQTRGLMFAMADLAKFCQ
ncbi:MAG: hypothetical protein EON60_09790 [Alphaproteobacteria bacterium]|nr:MAG: hypothetical protein EON60_09790 [Alphaproteobacteria bacterium]